MFTNVLKHPYVDILKLFAKDHWARAQTRGDVKQVIDRMIGKRVFQLQGTVSASNFLALPRPGSPPLGLDGQFLYLQLRLHQDSLFSIHLDILTDRRVVLRISLSNRYVCAKRMGSVLQLPMRLLERQQGRWTTLCIDLPGLLQAHLGSHEGHYDCMKSITLCSSMSFRNAMISDTLYSHGDLPRDMILPYTNGRAYDDLYGWEWLPEGAHDSHIAKTAAIESSYVLPPSPPSSECTPKAALPGPKPDAAGSKAARTLFRKPDETSHPQADNSPTTLKLKRVVGFSGEKYGLLIWLQEGNTILYAVAALLVLQEMESHEQVTLMGHTANICAISAAASSPLIASAQEGPLALVRLWDRAAGVCLAILQQHASDMQALQLTPSGSHLAGVGKDSRGRQLLAVWDVHGAFDDVPSCPLIDARVTLHHTRRMAWIPSLSPAGKFDAGELEMRCSTNELQLVTCGYENIRFWRLRRGKLHSCGLTLQHHDGQMFLDIAIDSSGTPGGSSSVEKHRRMLVGSSLGHLFQVDLTTRRLEYVFALHEAPINTILLSAGFAVTGSDDRKLRVWPLDFGSHFLEADHEGRITSLSSSPDGLKLLIGTSSGCIGVLDVPSVRHVTLVRSHTDIIYGLAMDPHNREFATASCDGSVRIWELDSPQQQMVEFELPQGCARCMAYHPTEYTIACGFDDGCVRIFDIASTSLLEEYKQHNAKVLALVFNHSARRLFSAAADGGLCAYDVLHAYQPTRSFAASPSADSPCLAVSPEDALLAVGGLQAKALLLFDCSSMTMLRTVPLSTDVHALTFGPLDDDDRMLLCSTADKSFLTFKISVPVEGENGVDVSPSSVKMATGHREVCETLATSINGKFLASGGNDHMVKIYPVRCIVKGNGTAAGHAQSFVGHSDHVTNLQFSPDGATLVSVGGGDAIFLWEFCGGTGVDPVEVVDESVRLAARERESLMATLQAKELANKDTIMSPSEALICKTHESMAPNGEGVHVLMASNLPTELALQTTVETLKGRMQVLEIDEPEEPLAEHKLMCEREDADVGMQKAPRKLYQAPHCVGRKESHRAEEVTKEEAMKNASVGISDDSDWIGIESEPGGLASRLAEGIELTRLNGFNTCAHDHVVWQQKEGRLIYSSGNNLILDPLHPDSDEIYYCTEAGEISTLAISPCGRFVVVGCGVSSALLVYDLNQARSEPFCRLIGHDGGVQSLDFLDNWMLLSLGLADSLLRLHYVKTAQLICTCAAPPRQLTVSSCMDHGEVSTGGEGGVFSWAFQMPNSDVSVEQGEHQFSSASLHPLDRRIGTEAIASVGAQVTVLEYLSNSAYPVKESPFLLAGDSEGNLVLWHADGEMPTVWSCAEALGEVDLLHGCPDPFQTDDEIRWLVIAAGVGPQNPVHRYLLTFKKDGEFKLDLLGEIRLDGAALGMSWAADVSQGVLGTDGGTLWHLHWDSMRTTSLMSVGASSILQLAIPLEDETPPAVLATISPGSNSSDAAGVLLWPTIRRCSAPVASVHMPGDHATCCCLYNKQGQTLCAVAHKSGAVRVVKVNSLEVANVIQVHSTEVCCIAFCQLGPTGLGVISAAADGEVRLLAVRSSVSEAGEHLELRQLDILRAATGVRVHHLDVLPSQTGDDCTNWVISSEHQQVQVWPLIAAATEPLATIELELEPLVVVPSRLSQLGLRCLAAFCPHHRQVVACCGVTREQRLLFYDYIQLAPILAVPLQEWPTSLAFSSSAPVIALAGAHGRVVLISYPEDHSEFSPQLGACKLDVVTVGLHSRSVRSLFFSTNFLYTASDQEVAQWRVLAV